MSQDPKFDAEHLLGGARPTVAADSPAVPSTAREAVAVVWQDILRRRAPGVVWTTEEGA
jgi:hypothetical protein